MRLIVDVLLLEMTREHGSFCSGVSVFEGGERRARHGISLSFFFCELNYGRLKSQDVTRRRGNVVIRVGVRRHWSWTRPLEKDCYPPILSSRKRREANPQTFLECQRIFDKTLSLESVLIAMRMHGVKKAFTGVPRVDIAPVAFTFIFHFIRCKTHDTKIGLVYLIDVWGHH